MAIKPYQTRGSVVCITGASAGIGAATAIALEKQGAKLALCARRVDRLNALRATFQLPGEHAPIEMDVADAGSVERGFRAIDQKFGKLDALVANAGVGAWYRVDETPEEEIQRTLETNVAGVIRCIRAGVPLLRKAGGGRIVLVSSVVGRRGVPMMGLYSASKFALHGLADAMRIELEPEGIAVSVYCPALTMTEFHDAAQGDKGEKPPTSEGETADAVAAGLIELLRSGKPEAHRFGALHPKRWAGVITQLAPRLMDNQLRKYYEARRAASHRAAVRP